jgi:hypothetical protein
MMTNGTGVEVYLFKLRTRLERIREALSKRAGGADLVTSHVVRQVIECGLDSIERELGRR